VSKPERFRKSRIGIERSPAWNQFSIPGIMAASRPVNAPPDLIADRVRDAVLVPEAARTARRQEDRMTFAKVSKISPFAARIVPAVRGSSRGSTASTIAPASRAIRRPAATSQGCSPRSQ
jgi:hypothetical protein